MKDWLILRYVLDTNDNIDLTGETLELHKGIDISGKTIIGGTFKPKGDYSEDDYGGALLHVRGLPTTLIGCRVEGWGNLDWNVSGLKCENTNVTIASCIFDNWEYAAIQLLSCSGEIVNTNSYGPAKESGRGLDYGILLEACSFMEIKGCDLSAFRHAIVLGEHCNNVEVHGNKLIASGDVNTYASKPYTRSCNIYNNTIYGGINPFGVYHHIYGNTIIGRSDYPQSSCCIYYSRNEKVVTCNHIITGNILEAGNKAGWRGAVHVDMEKPSGHMVLANNLFIGPEDRLTGNCIGTHVVGDNYGEGK